VQAQGLVQSMGEFVTATLDAGAFVSTTVRVLGAAEVPALAACSPNPLLLPEDGTADLTIRLDIPPAMAVDVSLDGGAGFASTPATVTVPANALSATFQVLASPGATGMGSIEATLGTSTLTCPVTISNLPVTTHVVISELGVGVGGAADNEFVELYNPTSQEIDISGWRIQYKAAAATTTAYQNKAVLPTTARIASHGYYLVGSGGAGGYSGPVPPDAVYLAASSGNPTAFQFSGTAGHVRIGPNGISTSITDPTAIDTVGYGVGVSHPEGGAAAPAPGAASIERKANANATQMSMAAGGADALFGNALDTDNNGADFVLRAMPQPQSRDGGFIEP
jgi:hypothetical protein